MDVFQGRRATGSAEFEPDYERLAQESLATSGFRSVHEINVVRLGATLVLSGAVSTYYQKQVAQELVRRIAGGLTVVNDVEVP